MACATVWGKNVRSVARNLWRTGPLMGHPGAAILSAKTQRIGRHYGGFDSSQSKMLRFPGIASHTDAVIMRVARKYRTACALDAQTELLDKC